MANYPLIKLNKQGTLLLPQHTLYSEEYARSMCNLYLSEEYSSDAYYNVSKQYRLHAREPHSVDMALAYDIKCPNCGTMMKQVGQTLNYYDLGAYICPICNKKH